MILYVVRHGETGYNAEGRYAGSSDIPLNQTGIAQAEELARKLSDINKDMRFDVVISSPLMRARQTADIVCNTLGLSYDVTEQFAERNMGIYEGLTREEARKKYPETWQRLGARFPDDGPDNGETIRQVCERVAAGLEILRRNYTDKRVLLICHGFVGRAINRYCKNLSFDEMHDFSLGNCETAGYEL